MDDLKVKVNIQNPILTFFRLRLHSVMRNGVEMDGALKPISIYNIVIK